MGIRTICFKISFFIIILSTQWISGQQNIASTKESDMLRARAYQISALEQYNNGNYDRALDYCIEIEKFLDTVDPEVEAIRIKSYYAIGDFSKAKISMDLFLRLSENKELTEEMLPYIVLIDDKIREEDELFQFAKNEKSVERFNEYIQKYPNGRFLHEANQLLEIQYEVDAWELAQQTATISGYFDYISAYPKGTHAATAREAIAALDYEAYTEAATENTQVSLNYYLDTYPKGEYRSDIEEKLTRRIEYDIYMHAKKTDNLDDYITYVEQYPEGIYTAVANEEIEEALYNFGNAAYDVKNYGRAKLYFDRYVTRFPNGLFIVDVQKKLKKCNRKAN